MRLYAGDVITDYPSLIIGFLGKVLKTKTSLQTKHSSDADNVYKRSVILNKSRTTLGIEIILYCFQMKEY